MKCVICRHKLLVAIVLALGLLLSATAFAQVPTPATAAEAPAGISLTLPRDLSPWGMFMAADIVVKAVMVGLAFASLLTWTIWFAKAIELLSGAAPPAAGHRRA